MLEVGEISMAASVEFLKSTLTDAQKDNEQARKFSPNVKRLFVGDSEIANLRTFNVRLGIRAPYYLKSFAMEFDDEHFDRFPGGMCIRYKNVDELLSRFGATLEQQLPGWAARTAAVQYVDFRTLPIGATQLDLMFLKDSSQYRGQSEYRIALIPPENHDLQKRQAVHLGPLDDIAEILIRN